MDGVPAGFRLKHPHLSEIGQAVRLRFVNCAASSHFRFEAVFNISG
jgi:hypothetical protein